MSWKTEEVESHIPVMLKEFLKHCSPKRDEQWIDGTFGYGGHTTALLDKGCKVLALDTDEDAQKRAEILKEKGEEFYFFRKNFSEMAEACFQMGWTAVDGILLDLGVSLGQLKDPKRGFSFQFPDAPLDMRMDRTRERTGAALLNTLSKEQLVQLFSVACNMKESQKLANEIVRFRSTGPIKKVGDFLEIVTRARLLKSKINAATRPFLALRIAVNEELEHLEKALREGTKLLKGGGRIAVISFHSAEDRIVKEFMRSHCLPKKGEGVAEEENHREMFFYKVERVLVSLEERKNNPRSRSARLRIAWKIPLEEKSGL
ncbi:16S rRNA (cytosine(1402)-N(4))-methyltransferase RsmH [Candidatus Methylacidiphilum infernorum]|uniref:Ribosomal RNA small subunit methyltransferase H n=1 Tax=Methylacidiphilum infernorum (isolate V4) TaxID=481448 RepID=RSMH_METI4|nr:16S rRNA (cytosine(1402)-N(4))-methyltransferase RsmH [Candidatus Methylacidiphilum infernorum]B3DVX0.1 RecName: Full=Ribosomal RNA small subunit methyltransferase H; AltName: Full=16S rRNA m(4)C1402 methyltransferase; AltName: Full=rRNA (cytosine-N(4)-)-methyltransferase RsmH [Methylacidiphilum infernorum V4]ACD83473.1 SAM methyltransferase involved MraW [Methylacidiphilum infernorum V4]